MLYWLLFIIVSSVLVYYGLYLNLEPPSVVCGGTLYLLFIILVMYLWSISGYTLGKSSKDIEWDESVSDEESGRKKSSTEKYSVEDRSTKEDKGILSRLLSSEDKCDECGSEMVYKEGAGSYYCPECKEYKW
ncbi:MAG: hypothetical protein V5A76_05400, partial [Candidatus Thermoplasmatota archaeon]